jgi:hypothetical protein
MQKRLIGWIKENFFKSWKNKCIILTLRNTFKGFTLSSVYVYSWIKFTLLNVIFASHRGHSRRLFHRLSSNPRELSQRTTVPTNLDYWLGGWGVSRAGGGEGEGREQLRTGCELTDRVEDTGDQRESERSTEKVVFLLAGDRGNWFYSHNTVLLHNGGFCNNCTPKRCLYISVHFKTNAL